MSNSLKTRRLLAFDAFAPDEISSFWERWSKNNRFGVRLSARAARRMIRSCRLSHPLETGGILIGTYTAARDCALIWIASGAPIDSSWGPTWFKRGTRHLQRWLDALWHKNQYYLGEWHYHPSAASTPSDRDRSQMKAISQAPQQHCPEPLLLIVGGDATQGYILKAFVMTKSGKLSEFPTGA
jgi:integrative and conjugative element protein (TIGR02256 family)